MSTRHTTTPLSESLSDASPGPLSGPRGAADWTRRRLLRTSGVGMLGGLTGSLGACSWLDTDPAGARDSGPAEKGPQAPMLARLVDAGDLPPLEERLPAKPLVVQPTQQTGQYGGTWRGALAGTQEAAYVYTIAGYENLVTWTPEWTGAAGYDEIAPNVAERFEANADATEFTFWLREGMKWSDGKPFTADDVVFAFEDVLLDPELFPVPPSTVTVEGAPATIEKLDDYSFRIRFPKRAGLFLYGLAQASGHILVKLSKAYLQQFHKAYNPKIDELVAAEGFADWIELFGAKSGLVWGYAENPDLPSIWPWTVRQPFGEGQQVVLERNPYYWKVDPDGSQLPYIDELSFDVVNSSEAMLLKALAGELDFEVGPDTRFTSPANKPVLARDRDAGDYRFVDASETRMNVMCIYLNLTHTDPAKREVFSNPDFRIGLSHAINRQELIEVAMQRQGEPHQVAPLPNSPFYDEEFATQYLEYDVDLANEHLDKAFPDKDADGLRLGPDNRPISFAVEYVAEFRPEWADMLELIRTYWREVGVDIQLKNEDRTLFDERRLANEHDANVWHGDGGLDVLQSPKNYFPNSDGSYYATPWGEWYLSGGESGEQPPDGPMRQMELFGRIASTGDAEEQAALMQELLTISKEEFYAIGIARETEKYFVAKNHFRNLPDLMIQGFTYPTPGPTRPEQYFIDAEADR